MRRRRKRRAGADWGRGRVETRQDRGRLRMRRRERRVEGSASGYGERKGLGQGDLGKMAKVIDAKIPGRYPERQEAGEARGTISRQCHLRGQAQRPDPSQNG